VNALQPDTVAETRAHCDAVDWDDATSILEQGSEALKLASSPATLRRLLGKVIESPSLISRCERFNLFSKIVLMEGASTAWKLRLHCFGSSTLEAHHHRATFCAQVIAGSYRHMLFGANASLDPERLKMPLKPLFMQIQCPGSAYMIDHEMVHITLAERETVSVMLQGPSVSEVFHIYEIETGSLRTRYGEKATQGIQELGEAKIGVADLRDLMESLAARGVVGCTV
jgi:hypothetical protein